MKLEKQKFLLIICFLIYLSVSIGFNSNNISRGVVHDGKLLYMPNTVVVKYKNIPLKAINKATTMKNMLKESLKAYNVQSIDNTFAVDNAQAQKIGLNRIMTIKYSNKIDPLILASKLKNLPYVEWAEPQFIRKVCFTPNDTSFYYPLQWNLFKIDAQHAWDISQGDTSIIIGIVDTGVDWPHPDLRANMWYKIGYDFGGTNGTPDNNPIEDNPHHGTLVAGVASAVTNNVTGIASIGFKSHLMAVKVSREDLKDPNTGDPYVVYGFQGIRYAADNGAKVINCSWGGAGYSNAEQDVINYALSKGALVVAAAGNDGLEEDFYPASYKGVLAVASTNLFDQKSPFSNYGYDITCTAPGENIYSTWQPNTYLKHISGTSLSAPLVSGLAALVFARFPNYTPTQVMQQIRINCDNIDSVNSNYKYLLGGGRINAYKTLVDSNSIAMRAFNFQYSDTTPYGNGDGIFQPGEKLEMKTRFRNYLSSAHNVSVTVQSMSPYATVQNGTFSISSLGTLDSTDNFSSPFTIVLSKNVPFNYILPLKLTFSGTNYNDFQLTAVSVAPSYETQSANNISLTITSQGNLGFNDYPNNDQGDGFSYLHGSNLLFEGSLMFGISPTFLSDEARGANQNEKDTSFQIVSAFNLQKSNSLSAEEGSTIFNDNGSAGDKLNITTSLHSYSFNDRTDNNYIMLNYTFKNNNDTTLQNFYAGLYFDWDMVAGSGDSDITVYDNSGNLGYTYHDGGNPNTYVGTALISSTKYGFWGIFNPGGDSGFGIYNGFSKDDKWKALSSGIGKSQAGPGDISEVTSAGPYTIPARKSIDVAFAIAAGNNLDDLRNAITYAREKYKTLLPDTGLPFPTAYDLIQNYPNPFNPETTIEYKIVHGGHVFIKIYDAIGRLVQVLVNKTQAAGTYYKKFNGINLASGVYFYRLEINNYVSTKKMVLLK